MLKEFLNFVFKMQIPKVANLTWGRKFFLVLILFFLLVPFTFLGGFVAQAVESFIVNTNSVSQVKQETSVTQKDTTPMVFIESIIFAFIQGIIFAPILEELTFRRGLVKPNLAWGFLVLGFLVNSYANLAFLFPPEFIQLVSSSFVYEIIFAVVKAIIIYGGLYLLGLKLSELLPELNSKIESLAKRNLPWLIVLTSLVFALVHVGNNVVFKSFDYLYLAPLLVLPQLFSGFELAYVAIRFGFVWAIVSHAVNNFFLYFMFTLLSGLTSLSGISLDNLEFTEETLSQASGLGLLGLIGLPIYIIFLGIAIIAAYIWAIVTWNKPIEKQVLLEN
jgi:membrane protease YdiL (CAAX protease family)